LFCSGGEKLVTNIHSVKCFVVLIWHFSRLLNIFLSGVID